MNHPRILTAVALVAATAMMLTACAGGTSPAPSTGTESDPVAGGNLTIARSDDATTFLPAEANQNADIWTLQQIYEGLVVNSTDGKSVVPAIATTWTTSEDGLTWSFTIRDGVAFQDGTPLTVTDVVWSLDYARTPSDLKGWADTYAPITSVTATDDSTVQITTKTPWPGLITALGLYAAPIYRANFGGQTEEDMRSHPNGTGPFMLDQWVPGQKVVLKKNPHYWQSGLPYLDSVTFPVVAEDNSRLLQLQGGQIDVDEFPSPASMATIKTTSGLVTADFPSSGVVYINLNTKRPELSDPKVRRAMSYALERQGIVDSVLSGFGRPANSFLSDTLFGWDESVNGATADLDAAKKLMAQSSSPDGFSLDLLVESGVTSREQIAEVAQAAWAELGIDVNIVRSDWGSMRTARNDGSFQSMIAYATSDTPDPTQMVTFLVTTNGTGIRSGYADSTAYALTDEALAAQPESDELAGILRTLQQKVADDAPMIPIAYSASTYALRDKVQNFSVNSLGTYDLTHTWLAP